MDDNALYKLVNKQPAMLAEVVGNLTHFGPDGRLEMHQLIVGATAASMAMNNPDREPTVVLNETNIDLAIMHLAQLGLATALKALYEKGGDADVT